MGRRGGFLNGRAQKVDSVLNGSQRYKPIQVCTVLDDDEDSVQEEFHDSSLPFESFYCDVPPIAYFDCDEPGEEEEPEPPTLSKRAQRRLNALSKFVEAPDHTAPSQRKQKPPAPHPTPIGYACCFLILSCVMWSMQTIAYLLKVSGSTLAAYL